VKYSPSGASLWTKRFGGVNADYGLAIAADSSSNVIVTRIFGYGTIDFGGGPLTNPYFNNDIFVVKLSSAGDHVWSKRFGGSSDDQARGVAVDSGGNVILSGFFINTVDFGGGPLTSTGLDIFVVKLSPSGAHLWSQRFGSTSSEAGNGVAVDGSSNVVVTGYFAGTVDFGGGPLTSVGGFYYDIFLLKLAP